MSRLTLLCALGGCAVQGRGSAVTPSQAENPLVHRSTRTPRDYPIDDVSLTWTQRIDGLVIADLHAGQGDLVDGRADLVLLEITGWLPDGTRWWSSFETPAPTRFLVGTAPIRAWDLSVVGMREGGIRLVEAPAALVFRSDGAQGRVPPDSPVRFALELLDVRPLREVPFPISRPPDASMGQTTIDGIDVTDVIIGSGALIEKGALITFERTEWLANGAMLGTSYRDLVPLSVIYGDGLLRWESLFAGMREGGTRQFIVEYKVSPADSESVLPNDEPITIAIELQTVQRDERGGSPLP